ncbi:hypothetical protein RHT_00956 [Candidatus Rhabdochlamydia sp. T3358]|nr:hypothetical protein RHT_00956 [Candidatus Rhabdochlamydia sp. T3358]
MGLDDRKRALDDFAAELKACSIINFYIACDRSLSRLEINGRVWVRSFSRAGKSVGEVSVSIIEGAGGGIMYVIQGAGKGTMYLGKTAGGGFMCLGGTVGKGFEDTGKGLVRIKNWVATTLGGIDMEDVNHRMKKVNCGLKTAHEIAKSAQKLQGAWGTLNGASAPQGSSTQNTQAQNHPKMDRI